MPYFNQWTEEIIFTDDEQSALLELASCAIYRKNYLSKWSPEAIVKKQHIDKALDIVNKMLEECRYAT